MKHGKDNITLIGMPAAGKSTVGVLLAKRLGYQFIDSDLLIQQAEGRLLKDIIAEQGIDGFIEVENRINRQIRASRTVIAPGGSVVYGKEAMEHLRAIGQIVYLKLSYENLERRLGSLTDRGVLLKEGMTLKSLYEERTPLYEQYADITVEESGTNPGEVVDILCEILQARTGDEKSGLTAF
jgi:shikimate kinase